MHEYRKSETSNFLGPPSEIDTPETRLDPASFGTGEVLCRARELKRGRKPDSDN